jgi:hypothetical protein
MFNFQSSMMTINQLFYHIYSKQIIYCCQNLCFVYSKTNTWNWGLRRKLLISNQADQYLNVVSHPALVRHYQTRYRNVIAFVSLLDMLSLQTRPISMVQVAPRWWEKISYVKMVTIRMYYRRILRFLV